MLCFRCGHDNPDTPEMPRFCDRCNARLPDEQKTVEISKESPKTARLEKIINTGNKFINGECSSEDFLNILKNQKKSFGKSEEHLKNMNIPLELREEFNLQIETGLKGIGLYKKAIELMESTIIIEAILTDEAKKTILQAIEIAKEGNEKITECYRMSEEKLRQIREETPLYKDYSSGG